MAEWVMAHGLCLVGHVNEKRYQPYCFMSLGNMQFNDVDLVFCHFLHIQGSYGQ